MKILFIGGTGVISSACSELCVKKGYELYLLNRNQSFRKPPAGARVINADIRDVNGVEALLKGERFDSVVDWIAYTEEHVKNDYEIFLGKTDQYIFISSASAYIKPPVKLPITEDTQLKNPFWEYSRNKISCEYYLLDKFGTNDFPVTICRPSHTYDKTKISLYGGYTALNRMKMGREVILHDDGNSKWTLTNAKDFAKGFIGLIGNSATLGEAYHITSDEILTWNQIAEIIASAAGVELKLTYLPSEFISGYDSEWGYNLLGDKSYDTVFDNSKIRSIVPGFNASVPYSEGAREIIEWHSDKANQIVNRELDNLMDKMIADYKSR